MRGNNSDPESLQAFEALLEESLAVHPEAEARVLERLSKGLQHVAIYKPPLRETTDVWQQALKAAVMVALAVGLFAMVGRREPVGTRNARNPVVADDGKEKKTEAPKPDDTRPTLEEKSSDDPFEVLNSKVHADNAARECHADEITEIHVRQFVDPEAVSTAMRNIDKAIFPYSEIRPNSREVASSRPAPNVEAACKAGLLKFFSTNAQDVVVIEDAQGRLSTIERYVRVPVKATDEDRRLILAFCRCGIHSGTRHVLYADGSVETVSEGKELLKAFHSTARILNMSLEKSQPADDAARLKKLIENLSDDDYTVRESATRALIGAGSTATESIESGAASDDLERASRCKEILLAHKRNDELRRELGLSK